MTTLTQTKTYKSPVELMNDGYQALIERLGPVNAAKFSQLFSAGFGDSVKEYQEIWKGLTLDQIHQEVLALKKSGKL